MDINEIINSIPYLTKSQLYQLHSEVTVTIRHTEEAEQKRRENIRKKQSEIVNEMNMLLREFHTLSALLRTPDANDYMEGYTDCFVDGDYEMPVFGFTIDNDSDICVSVNLNDNIAEWYRKEQEERKNKKKG